MASTLHLPLQWQQCPPLRAEKKVGCCFWCAIAWSIQLILLLLPGFSYCPSDNPHPHLFHRDSLIYKISIERLQFHICEMADNVY